MDPNTIVIGTMVHIHAEVKVMQGRDKIDLSAIEPVGRLMGGGFYRMADLIELKRSRNIIGGKT